MFALYSWIDELLGSKKAGAILKKGREQPGKWGSLNSDSGAVCVLWIEKKNIRAQQLFITAHMQSKQLQFTVVFE